MINEYKKKSAKSWLDSSYLGSVDIVYIEKLYEDFLVNHNYVDNSWKMIFEEILYKEKDFLKKSNINTKEDKSTKDFKKNKSDRFNSLSSEKELEFKKNDIFKLINSFRLLGHKQANIDPLNLLKKEEIPDLDIDFYSFSKNDLQKEINTNCYLSNNKTMKISDLYCFLKRTYCGSVGIEYMHISNDEEKHWIQKRIECGLLNHTNFSYEERIKFLKTIIAAEELEHYLGNMFPGSKRFSIEGEEALILILKDLIKYSSKNNIKEIILGMAHRGRLNVLVNVLGKNPKDLFNEFIDKYDKNKYELSYKYSGDVKYHQGFYSEIQFNNKLVRLLLSSNPSHLEIISPVIIGMVRARIDQSSKIDNYKILPIVIHGDAAISGQGVVQETLNMSKVKGYEVGGTIHLVINNQIGFTTSNCDIRSSRYCTDIAKMIEAPIFHVNADDPEAAVLISRLALDFRNTFKRDVFIDLVGYRRHGHNEIDDPSVTQPIMYKIIKKHPTIKEIYIKHLKNKKIISSSEVSEIIAIFREKLDKGKCVIEEIKLTKKDFFYNLSNNTKYNYNSKFINSENLKSLAFNISKLPSTLTIQSRVAKIYQDRLAMAKGEKLFDWGGAELLAYATLLDEGFSIRLSGEDSVRGTFFHRHAMVFDQNNDTYYVPLTNIHNKQGIFSIWNSVLSEEAVLAFEYGYSIASKPNTLVIWEAQFGDFANGAQIVIDQFISSGNQKWGVECNIVMLLPHGYEGQGPEHSSARLERYLQLCAENNMKICIPSTPKQIYHILRLQALSNVNKPLILISPKSLLRHPMATSSLGELANGVFEKVIGEIDQINPRDTKKVIICCGKIYYDLLYQRRKNKQKNIAIIRVEQLYPFPVRTLQEILSIYKHVKDIIWCQEEPKNQGAWYCSQEYLKNIIPNTSILNYLGRPSSASPAVGHLSMHHIQQQKIISEALKIL